MQIDMRRCALLYTETLMARLRTAGLVAKQTMTKRVCLGAARGMMEDRP